MIGQLVLCTVLLIAAGLLVRTVTNLRTQELGFDRNVLLVSVATTEAASSPEAATLLIERACERLTAVKGILAAGVSDASLLDSSNYWIDGTQTLTTDRGDTLPAVRYTFMSVGTSFFEAVDMRLVHGRTFENTDSDHRQALVINQSLARVLFGGDHPIGRWFKISPEAPIQTVIGVVQDAKQTSPRERGLGVIYQPLRNFQRLTLAVRVAGSPAAAAPVVRHQLAAVAPELAIDGIRTIGDLIDEGTRELGIRLALGATGTQILGLVRATARCWSCPRSRSACRSARY